MRRYTCIVIKTRNMQYSFGVDSRIVKTHVFPKRYYKALRCLCCVTVIVISFWVMSTTYKKAKVNTCLEIQVFARLIG